MLNLKRSRDAGSSVADVVTLEREPSTPLTAGEQLRLSRERFDLQLEDVADYLKIRRQHLEAIEEGRVEDLPGHTYAIGFVRAYADYLGLDPATIVERFKDETAASEERSSLVFPTPMPEGRTPGGALILIAVIGVAMVYGAWIYLSSQDRSLAEIVPALPESLQRLIASDDAPSTQNLTASDTVTPIAPATTNSTPASADTEERSAPEKKVVIAAVMTNIVATPDQSGEIALAPTPDSAAASSSSNTKEASVVIAPPPIVQQPAKADRSEATPKIANVVSSIQAAEPTVEATGASVEKETTAVALSIDELKVSPPPRETASVPEISKPTISKDVASILDSIDIPGVATETGASRASAALPPTPPVDEQTGPRQFGVENGKSRITIVAIVDSWVEIRDGGGALLLTRLLKAGDSYLVPDQPGLKMHTGNAGGLRLEVDGKTAPPIGPKGAVRRDVALDPEVLKRVAADG